MNALMKVCSLRAAKCILVTIRIEPSVGFSEPVDTRTQTTWPSLHFWLFSGDYLGRAKRIWYLSHMRAAKVQASLRIRAVSPEPPLLAHTSSESRGTFRRKARSLAPLNGWACAVKICHDGCSKTQIRLTRPICVLYHRQLLPHENSY